MLTLCYFQDHKDKVSAQNLDNSAAALHNNTTTLSHRPHTVRVIARGTSHPQQWQNFTEVNIAKAEKERDNSKNLRSATDGVLRQTTGTFTCLNYCPCEIILSKLLSKYFAHYSIN